MMGFFHCTETILNQAEVSQGEGGYYWAIYKSTNGLYSVNNNLLENGRWDKDKRAQIQTARAGMLHKAAVGIRTQQENMGRDMSSVVSGVFCINKIQTHKTLKGSKG